MTDIPLPSFKLIGAGSSKVPGLSTHTENVVALSNSNTPHIFTYDEYNEFITNQTNIKLTCYKPSIPIKKLITNIVFIILLIVSLFIIIYFALEKNYGIFSFIPFVLIVLYFSHGFIISYITNIKPGDSVYIIQKPTYNL